MEKDGLQLSEEFGWYYCYLNYFYVVKICGLKFIQLVSALTSRKQDNTIKNEKKQDSTKLTKIEKI